MSELNISQNLTCESINKKVSQKPEPRMSIPSSDECNQDEEDN
jgi:hypothetical protein